MSTSADRRAPSDSPAEAAAGAVAPASRRRSSRVAASGPEATVHTSDHPLPSLGRPIAVDADGIPVGFHSGRTLGLRVELARQVRRRRTQLSLLLMAALPVILLIAFSVGSNSGGRGSSFVDLAKAGADNFVVVSLFFASSFLLTVVVSLFFGDTIASEASWSSLRYLLAMPVPRVRLIRQKVLAAGVLALAALVLLAVSAWVVGVIAYGSGPLTTPIGDQFGGSRGIVRLLLILGYVAVQMLWVAALAFLLSVTTDAPLGAVGGAVLLSILSQILDQISALDTLRNWLPTHYAFSWTGAAVQPVRWDDMVRGGFSALAYATVFFGLAVWRFRRKDITS